MSIRNLIRLIMLCFSALVQAGVPDTPFIQEYHTGYPIVEKGAANDVRAVAVDGDGGIWAATQSGVYQMSPDSGTWQQMMTAEVVGPAFAAASDADGGVWIGAWNGVYHNTASGLQKVDDINAAISAIGWMHDKMIALGPDGMWVNTNGAWNQHAMPYARQVTAVLSDPADGCWIATGMGLYHQRKNDLTLYQSADELLCPALTDLAFDKDGKLWVGGLGGITVYHAGRRVGQYTADEGLHNIDVQAVEQAPDGTMWIGTKLGIARFDGQDWSIRHGRRWLLDDDVRDIVFDKNGTAWIATARGVSTIKRRKMTLVEKERYFRRICMKRHVREPGLVEKCRLLVPGDTTRWEPRDDDNDGEYTSFYLVMESLRYAVTRSEDARRNAKMAFEGLRFLQTVTETDGFVARTVVPSDWKRMADPNRTYTPEQVAEHRVNNPRFKKVEGQWRLSKDGKWLWKGDTSSDEITGHLWGYLYYYDLVADKQERKRVAAHICKIMDYIIDCGYVLKDIDGAHTKWAVWSPEKLNHDPDWQIERGINSAEILSYLKLAYHVSGKKRYQKEYLKLLYEHNYVDNVLIAKRFNPGWITHIDDELLALVYPCLLLHETDPALKRLYRKSIDIWYSGVQKDKNAFFEYTYSALTGVPPMQKISLFWLRDMPLDLVRWRMDNTKRADLKLVRYPEFESIQTDRLLPISEISFTRQDRNPWYAIQGDGGHTESNGVFWLLPYWMGRYYGYIE